MAVYIKDVTKPQKCWDCRFWEIDYCVAMGKWGAGYPDYSSFAEFYEHCPLIPVDCGSCGPVIKGRDE